VALARFGCLDLDITDGDEVVFTHFYAESSLREAQRDVSIYQDVYGSQMLMKAYVCLAELISIAAI